MSNMTLIPPSQLNAALTPNVATVAGSLASAADVRSYGQLDDGRVRGTAPSMSFVEVVMSAIPS